jgi:hypothetical protein
MVILPANNQFGIQRRCQWSQRMAMYSNYIAEYRRRDETWNPVGEERVVMTFLCMYRDIAGRHEQIRNSPD